MDWKTWDVAGWNKALVASVFLDTERLEAPITRIEASAKFLSECTGDPECSASEAHRHFLAAFGKSARAIRGRFLWSSHLEIVTARDGIPSIFASLYLTLLAASADETTYDEGNFRNRFVELLRPVELAAPNFAELPRLWRHVEKWSIWRARRSGDCRVLRLPVAPSHEKLIGYSKRLAFPCYSDELKLQRLLQQEGLNSDSDFTSVARAISWQVNSFSNAFAEEFSVFNGLVARGRFKDAVESPLWVAVQTITWELAYTVARESGRFCLGVDLSDPLVPDCFLLADAVGRQTLGKSLQFKDAYTNATYKHVAVPPRPSRWTIAGLAAMPGQVQALRRVKLWQQFAAGCTVLFPDRQGSLTSDGEHSDSAPVCIVARQKLADTILKDALGLGIKASKFVDHDPSESWALIFLTSISTLALSRLAALLPKGTLGCQWKPPRVSFAGGAWFGQSVLLNPASVPLAYLPEASDGRFQLEGEQGVIVAEHSLEPVEDRFRIPPSAVANTTEARRVHFLLEGPDGDDVRATVPVVVDIPLLAPVSLKDPRVWLVDGPNGVMHELAGRFKSNDKANPPRGGGKPQWEPRLARAQCESWEKIAKSDVNSLPSYLAWLSEALLLRFQRRSTLPFADLQSHVEPCCEATGLDARKVVRLLVSGGWLCRIQRRGSPSGAFAPTRTIASLDNNAGTEARIVGMLSRSERSRLVAMLRVGESAFRICGTTCTLGLGAIELQLAGPARVTEIASEFGLDVLDRADFGSPISLSLTALDKKGAAYGSPEGQELEVWDNEHFEWSRISVPNGMAEAGALFRLRTSHGERFWISTGKGYLTTDSLTWARFLELSTVGKPIGLVAGNGDCTFRKSIRNLPSPLVRWWMHWGGGYVSLNASGELVLAAGSAGATRGWLERWLQDRESDIAKGRVPRESSTAMERRLLALRLRRGLGSRSAGNQGY